ncbi:MAG: prolyl oligopeptidase family serine peptidase [Candidatus Andeanibacterium colombiense]|uniref:Prolyl oligopeptidase family serine peptidase n=1 Tax=Candidatus Andeanibacterium colombiense TaxID=3121345 RepID=A0AAJ5X7B5_9SPHN|nr:MAG: prolyl oligopeptidase family serine peptidase [Sphingomonadaceae bacterium]
MRIVSIASAALLTCASVLAQPAVAAPPPLDAYGDLPGFEDAAISPSGKHVAVIGTVEGERKLLLFDGGMTLVGHASVGDLKVRGIQWIGDDNVLLTYSKTEALGFGFTSNQYEAFQTLIVPLDAAQKVSIVFGHNSSIVTSIFGSYGLRLIGGKWKGYFGGVQLMGTGMQQRLETTSPTLFEVGLPDNSTRKIAAPGGDYLWRDWLIDEHGEVAATFDMERETGNWRIKDAKGKVIAKGANPGGDASLISLGKDGTTLIYSAKAKGEEDNHWYELPLTGVTDPVEVMQGINVDSIYVERTTGRLIGYIDGDQRVFFGPKLQSMSDKISRAFKNLKVTLEDWTPDFGHVLLRTSGNGDSGTWYAVDLNALKADPLGSERPVIPADEVGPISKFEYKAADGLEMDGVLTLPPHREAKNLPVIVFPHGGPTGQDDVEFDWWAQAFASRGYAVFQPNFRGSTNRDEAFHRAGYGQWGRKMQTDISDGLAALVAKGLVDPKRACIMGGSYGGYAALAGVTLQQGLYRCSVAVAPVSDVELMYDTDYAESGSVKVVKMSLLEELGPRSTLDEVSPRRFAAKADAPILLIHGKDDTVVPYEQSTKMADALKDAHKPYEFVDMKSEDHWLSHAETRKQMLAAAMAFVQKYNPAD